MSLDPHDARVEHLRAQADEQAAKNDDKKYYLTDARDVDVLLDERDTHILAYRQEGGETGPYVVELIHRGRRFIHSSMKPIFKEVPNVH